MAARAAPVPRVLARSTGPRRPSNATGAAARSRAHAAPPRRRGCGFATTLAVYLGDTHRAAARGAPRAMTGAGNVGCTDVDGAGAGTAWACCRKRSLRAPFETL